MTVSSACTAIAERRTAVGVEARGDVERDAARAGAVDGGDDVGQVATDGPVEPGAEERVDDDVGAGQGRLEAARVGAPLGSSVKAPPRSM